MKAVLAVGVAATVAVGLGIGWVVSAPASAASGDGAPAKGSGKPAMSVGGVAAESMAVLGGLVGGGGGGPDPDTVPNERNTIRMFGSEVTIAQGRGGHLSPARYLPDWAPVYPGAELRQKLVQRKDGHVIGRGTEFSTDDGFDQVVKFYDDYFAAKGITPKKVLPGKYGKVYVFDQGQSYQSMLNLQNLGAGGDRRVVHIAVAQAAAE